MTVAATAALLLSSCSGRTVFENRKPRQEDIPVRVMTVESVENTGTKSYVGTASASKSALPEYMRLLISSESEDVRNTCVDYVKEFADDVKEETLKYYKSGVRSEYMLEILSRCKARDEDIFGILLAAFRTADDGVLALRASYLAAYGDERALPYLTDRIEDEAISYADFQDLKFAIEALGGTYERERDFSSDPYYDLIKSHGAIDIDIFKDIK